MGFNLGEWVRNLFQNDYVYTLVGGNGKWGSATSYDKKIRAVLENPAAMYVFLMLAELFSMGKYQLKRNDEIVDSDPILDLLRNPNPLQTNAQFKYDYMFHRKLGTANLYIHSKIPTERNALYFLHHDCIVWPKALTDNAMSLVFSESQQKQNRQQILKYKTARQEINFKLDQLQQFHDISNGLTGFYTSPSRIDALYKIIANSDNALKSKNINTDFISKFLVSGQVDVENTSKMPLSPDDKNSIESVMRGKRSIFATKSQVSINRFIDKGSILAEIDKSFMTDAFLIGKMLNVPKDVMEMLGDSSTYENQEKARSMVISYCIQPDADDFGDGILKYFNYPKEYSLTLTYDHLPFVQTLERDRAEANERKANAFSTLVTAGADPLQVAEMLNMDLNKFNGNNGGTEI